MPMPIDRILYALDVHSLTVAAKQCVEQWEREITDAEPDRTRACRSRGLWYTAAIAMVRASLSDVDHEAHVMTELDPHAVLAAIKRHHV